MDRIEVIKTQRGVSHGVYDRQLGADATKVIEGYAFRCKACGRIFLNSKDAERHQCSPS